MDHDRRADLPRARYVVRTDRSLLRARRVDRARQPLSGRPRAAVASRLCRAVVRPLEGAERRRDDGVVAAGVRVGAPARVDAVRAGDVRADARHAGGPLHQRADEREPRDACVRPLRVCDLAGPPAADVDEPSLGSRLDCARVRHSGARSRAHSDLGDCDRTLGCAVDRVGGTVARVAARVSALLAVGGGNCGARGRLPAHHRRPREEPARLLRGRDQLAVLRRAPWSMDRLPPGGALDRGRVDSRRSVDRDARERRATQNSRADRGASGRHDGVGRLARRALGDVGVVVRRRHPRALRDLRRSARTDDVRGLPGAQRHAACLGARRRGRRLPAAHRAPVLDAISVRSPQQGTLTRQLVLALRAVEWTW